MSDYVTTTSSSFPVKDITHKPKRMQGDMIKLKEADMGIADTDSVAKANEPLSVITLERAISHYKSMSDDETNGKLYLATAKWLEELLVTRTLKTEAAVKAVINEENNSSNGEENNPEV